jgi:hypothetical protein
MIMTSMMMMIMIMIAIMMMSTSQEAALIGPSVAILEHSLSLDMTSSPLT